MNILYIEPFYAGSHKQWIESYQKYSHHDIDIIGLPGVNWKWRMHGGAVTLANQLNTYKKHIDLIICSDFLNLPVFKSLIQKEFKNIPIIVYFHENQISYPWSPIDRDPPQKRDLHYYYINYTSSLCSKWNLFNSSYHMDSYIKGLKSYLKMMPDHMNIESIKDVEEKSSVLYIGCDLIKLDSIKTNIANKALILWNHRWEFDKNPESFFNTLFKLKENDIDFNLAVLGESFEIYPDIFDIAKEKLKEHIVQWGYCKSGEEYKKWLQKADIVPITSIQEFFGISAVEAAHSKIYPILPNRLSYPEIFNITKRPDIFYDNDDQLYDKLKNSIINIDKTRESAKEISKELKRFDWSTMILEYDQKFVDFIHGNNPR